MKKIKEARIKHNLTQHQMSELTGVPFRTIQNWEGGQRECPRYVRNLVIEKLDRMLGASDLCPKCEEKQTDITDKNFKSNNSEVMRNKEKQQQIDEIAECVLGGTIDYRLEVAELIYNKDFRKQSEWVRVEDKLPKTNTDVIIYHEGYIEHQLDIYTYLGSNKWEDCYGYWHKTEDVCITHWMPLPEAPKMKGGEKE